MRDTIDMAREAGLIQESEYFYSPREEEADVHIKDLKAFEALVRADERALAAPVQEPVAWPAGLIDRIKAAEQRIQDGHAPRRIPADPTDVDLVLAEVRYLLEGKQPPFWIKTTPPAAQRQWVGLTDDDYVEMGISLSLTLWQYKAIEAKLKEKNT